ncbi:MAG: trigger factor [Clostridia bacterium]|nr:trigger factor [Clostridia bacterium]
MKATVTKISSNQVKIEFAVEPEVFEEGLQKAYRKIVKRVNVPGFRRGHVPRKVLEMQFGESILYEDALDEIFPDLYSQAVKENDLHPVDQPSLDVQQIGKGKELQFTCEVYVRPDVELGQYKGLKAVKNVEEVTDDDVNAEIERARQRIARYEDVTDRPAQLDDQVDIDYQGFVGDEQFEGGTAQGHKLVLGSGSFIPGFEDQLVGANVGDEVEVKVTFPEDYHAENLKGKDAVFHVKVNGIQFKDVPELDDEFAKDVSECETLAQYREEVRKKLEEAAENRADVAFENELLDKAVARAKVDIPAAMIEDQIDSMMREMEMRMMYQGMRMDDYLKYTGQTKEQVREMYRSEADSRVRGQLVLDAIRKAEGIEADEAETDREIDSYAEQTRQKVEEFRKTLADGDREYFRNAASVKKTIDFLKANAEIVSPEDDDDEEIEMVPAQDPEEE